MTFKPSSKISLCYVNLDATNKHQIYFPNKTKQQEYFANRVVKTFTEYLTVRTTKEDGSLQSSVKVDCNIETLRSTLANYMFYCNENHGDRIFYAFITKLVYINEGTTEIIFEADVFQTWFFDVTIKESYVVREHSVTDNVGDNLVPEKFNFQDYGFISMGESGNLTDWGYLVATTEQKGSDGSRGKKMSGIYQGLYFYYYHNENNLNDFLDEIEGEGGDCVVFIAVIPKFCLKANTIGDGKENAEGWLSYSSEPATAEETINFDSDNFLFNGYKPVNKKLFTSPYFELIVTNHNGDIAEYRIEDFNKGENMNEKQIKFKLYGDVSSNPSVTLIPLKYQDISENYDCGISISGFPQCAFNSDTFKLWLAKNQYGIALDTVGNLGSIAMGLATGVGSGGVGAVIGGGQVMSGVSGILSTVNSVYQASKEPNKSHSGSAKNNLLTAMKKNTFQYMYRYIKKEYAKTVDDFFTMYGYQTNKLKIPNRSTRPYYNYVQTIDINIFGGIPSDDMERLKQIYNNGVTIWKHDAVIGDYSVDNRPA